MAERRSCKANIRGSSPLTGFMDERQQWGVARDCRSRPAGKWVQILPHPLMGSSAKGRLTLLQSVNVGSIPTGSTNAQVAELEIRASPRN